MTPLLTFNATRHVSLSLTTVATGIAAIATLATLTTSNSAAAQTTQAEPVALPAVVVTASRLPQTLSDTIANTTLITRSDIERSGAVDLPGLLSGQAGVEIGSSGGRGQQASVFMRGADSTHTLILLDGVPLNSQVGGAAQLELIALDAIDRIEIVRGNVSAQYGSRAVGGVIQLFSKASGTANNRSASIELGTQGHKKASVNLNLSQGNIKYGVNASRTLYAGQSAIDVGQSVANPDKDGYGKTLLSAYINAALTPDFKASLSVSDTDMKLAYDNDGAPSPSTDVQNYHKAATLYQISTQWQIAPYFKNVIKLSQTAEKAIGSNNNVYESTSKDKQTQLSVQNEFSLGAMGDLYANYESLSNKVLYEYIDPYGGPKSFVHEKRQAIALLAGWQGKQQGMAWNLNLRRERADKETINTYFAGLAYDITDNFSVKGSQSTAYVRPTIAEKFGFGSVYAPVLGFNPNLLSGEALNKEIALQWTKGKMLVRVGFFKQESTNQIEYIPTTKSLVNLKQARNQGMELHAEADAPWSHGKIKLYATKQNPINAITKETLTRRANASVSATLLGKVGAWDWVTTFTYQGDRADSFFETLPPYSKIPKTLKSYTKLDASLTYAITPQANIGLYLTNIGKANDQTAYGYSGTPRGAMVRLNYKM